MADQTAEEIKKDNIAKMGDPLGAQYSELWQELAHIHFKWAEFVELFGTEKDRVELLNRAAPLLFRTAQDALWESSLLHIARLTDPPKSMGKPNLTIQNLPALIGDADLKSKVAKLVDVALKECEFCRDWRHHVIAHRDLNLALKNPTTALTTASKQQVDAALKALADILNAVESHYKKAQTRFDLTPRHNGALTLLDVLGDGIRVRDEEFERLKKASEGFPIANAGTTPASPELPTAGKANKSNKLKPRLPRGLTDRGPAEIAATRRMIEAIRAVYERYGFEPVETPAIEYTDALGKFLPDQDRPNEGVFSFQDDDEQWLSLRYDLTAPLARYVAENFDALAKPYRSYRFGWVFRNEKPGPGRFWQFMQFDADTVGSASMAADAEMCMMAADTMEALGVPRGSYVVKVNNRKVLDGVLEAIGLGGEANVGKRLTVLRAIDKYDRLKREGVEALLGIGRKDESGDFTKGAGLAPEQISRVLDYVLVQMAEEAGDREGMFDDWRRAVGSSSVGLQGIEELSQMAELVRASNYRSDRISIESSVVRGLEYYTGPVYEVELTFETKDEGGKPVRFGSVGGGGRYDGLVGRFRSEPVPATGFSIGVSRLQAALTHLGKLDAKPEPGPVVVTVFDKTRIADYQRMVAALRNANIRAELYLGSGKMGPQLKYADKRGSPCVVIQGGDEKALAQVQIKDLIEGAKAAAAIASNQEWRASRPAQFAVAEDKLVEAVREVLARHDVRWD